MENAPPERRSRTPAQVLAFAVSAASSPYVVTGAIVIVAVWLLRPALPQLLLWGAISVLTGAVIPFLIVYALWRTRKLSDMHVAVREQREIPFAAALASGALGVVTLYFINAPPQLIGLGAVYLANGLLLALISLRWKISVHVGVLTAGIIAIALLGYPLALLGLLVVPMVLWARVYRGRHTLLQGLVPVALAAVVTPTAYQAVLRVLMP